MTSLKDLKQCFSLTTRKARRTMHRCEMIVKKQNEQQIMLSQNTYFPKSLTRNIMLGV